MPIYFNNSSNYRIYAEMIDTSISRNLDTDSSRNQEFGGGGHLLLLVRPQ